MVNNNIVFLLERLQDRSWQSFSRGDKNENGTVVVDDVVTECIWRSAPVIE